MSYPEPDDGGRVRDESVSDGDGLECVLVPHTDGPDELTLFPVATTGSSIMTRWITAREGAYVSLEDCR